MEIPSGPYGGGRPNALDWFETVQLYDPQEIDETVYSLPERILLNDFNNNREFIDPGDAGAEVDFRITADGRQVPITGVLLERSASKQGASITWHFRHALSFKPEELKEVRVEYRRDAQTFSGIFLPAETLRYIIREVYPGSRWNDTCLAEMSFTPVQSAPALIPWLEDPFFGENLKGFRF